MVMIDLRKPPVLVIATNPWLSGKLAVAAKKAGVNVKKFWYFRNPPPWSKYREYEDGASARQKEIWKNFKAEAEATKGMEVAERIVAIRKALKR